MSKHRNKIILTAIFICLALISVILYFTLSNDAKEIKKDAVPTPALSVSQSSGETSALNSAVPTDDSQTAEPVTMSPDAGTSKKAPKLTVTSKPTPSKKPGKSKNNSSGQENSKSNVVYLDDLEDHPSKSKPKATGKPGKPGKPQKTQKPEKPGKPNATEKPSSGASSSPNPQDKGWTDWY